jgi:hypothetical protein
MQCGPPVVRFVSLAKLTKFHATSEDSGRSEENSLSVSAMIHPLVLKVGRYHCAILISYQQLWGLVSLFNVQ